MVRIEDLTPDEVAATERRKKIAGLAAKFFEGCNVDPQEFSGLALVNVFSDERRVVASIYTQGDLMTLYDSRLIEAAKSFGAAYEREFMPQKVEPPHARREFVIKTDYSPRA